MASQRLLGKKSHFIRIFLLALFGFIMFIGCNVGAVRVTSTTESTHPPVVATKEKSPTATVAFTDQPTRTPTIPAALSQVIKPTLTVSTTPASIHTCPKVIEQPVDLAQVSNVGTVLMKDADAPWELIDLQTGESTPLPRSRVTASSSILGAVEVSPDLKSLAYLEFVRNSSDQMTTEILQVVDAKGSLVTTRLFYPGRYFNEWRWLNPEQLEILIPTAETTRTVSLFNPFTEEWQWPKNKFLDPYQDFVLRPSDWSVAYSPDMTWAVYLGQLPAGAGPVVWDITSSRVLWQASGPFPGNNVPQWSPYGNEVAVVVNGILYRINRQGQAKSVPLADTNEVVNFSWSPDGQHLAILVRDQPGSSLGRLLVYNISSGKTIDLCNMRDIPSQNPVPIWSPDSQMLIDYLNTGDQILVDVQNRVEYQLKPVSILAWMDSAPE